MSPQQVNPNQQLPFALRRRAPRLAAMLSKPLIRSDQTSI
jgi:hypothetical protein